MTANGAEASGRRLGRYHLAEPIGTGPTGDVYRAKVYGAAGFERQFAVKRFHPELVSNTDRAGLLAQTARVYAGLQHPRIARLHEFGVADSETFAATELVRGLDLGQLLALASRRNPGLLPGASAALVAAAARAIGFAHVRGLTHLGLCPSNVLCTVDGDVKVTDFGYLALRLPSRPGDDPALLARIAFLAPEQLCGEAGVPATDVFQLGLLACALLTGQSPLASADPREIQRRALVGELPVVHLDLPKPLAQVIRRALAISPRERYPDGGALADALDSATRTAPLAGDRRDLAQLVRTALEHPLVSPGSERALAAPSTVPPPSPPQVTLTGRPAPRQWPGGVGPASTNGVRGDAKPPASGSQVARPKASRPPSPGSVGEAARSAAESRPAPEAASSNGRANGLSVGSKRPPIPTPWPDTSEEDTTQVKEEALGADASDLGSPSDAFGSGGDDFNPPTLPERMMEETLVGQSLHGPGSNGKGRKADHPANLDQRRSDRARGPGLIEGSDDEGSTHPVLRPDPPPGTPLAPLGRESDSDFYAIETVTRPAGEGLPAPDDPPLDSHGSRLDSNTPLPDVRSPTPDLLMPMSELHELAAMLQSQPGVAPPPLPLLSPEGARPRSSPTGRHAPVPVPGPKTTERGLGVMREPHPAADSRISQRLPAGASPGARISQRLPAAASPDARVSQRLPAAASPDARVSQRLALGVLPDSRIPALPLSGADGDEEIPARPMATPAGLARTIRPPPTGSDRLRTGPTGPIVRTRRRSTSGSAPPRARSQLSNAPETDDVVTRRASNSQLASFGPDGAGDQWASPRQGSRGLKVALSALFMIVLAGIGYVGYLKLLADQPASARPRGTPPGEGTVDRAAATGSPAEDRSAAESGTGAGAAGDDARPGSTPPPGSVESAASAGEPAISGPAGRDEPAAALVITSQPGRARVYIDGASIGRTPLTLEPNNDRHKIAIIEPGYKPHIAEVDGRGKVSVVLEEVTPPNGPAGIKIRCRQKNRYYVTLDGEPTGQLCPTERLGVELGDHTAEIYDPVTDSRRAYKVRVGQTRLSVRVRVD